MKLLAILTLFSQFLLLSPVEANLKEKLKKGLLKPITSNPLINEVVDIKPIEGHHFNLEAPQNCGKESSIKATAKAISCQFHSDGEREVVVSVCDHKKTYCKQEKVKTQVQKIKSAQSKIKESPSVETLKMQNSVKKKLLSRFKVMTPDEAVQAVPMKKAALVMVSADWCPPCNQAKEFMLQTKDFKEATKNLLLIYVDGDSPASEVWTQKLKTRYYPSFIVLNQDLERVSVFSDINSADHIQKLSAALNHIEDPLSSVEQRITERENGEFLRKVKDFFNSSAFILEDQKRHIGHLKAVGKYDELLAYLEKIESKKAFEFVQKEAYYLSSKEKDEEFLESFLNQDPSASPFYYYALRDYCQKTKLENQFSKACMGYRGNYLQSLKIEAKWPEEEKSLTSAVYSKIKAKLYDFFEEEKKAMSFYSQCVEDFEKLYEVSPLGKKSRSVRIEQIGCVKDENQGAEILKTLAKDYPFEETFHRKLARLYAKENKYEKALDNNQRAIDYSYGYMWLYNVAERVKYLKELSREQEALELVESALSEVVLNKEDARTNNALQSLRAQYDTLKVL